MTLEILASGSSGNSYLLSKDGARLLIECGLPEKQTLAKLNYRLPDGILLTHEHGDHAKSARNFLERGVAIYMTAGTAEALQLKRHNLHIIAAGAAFEVSGFKVKAVGVKHDAAEPVNFIIDELLMVTEPEWIQLIHVSKRHGDGLGFIERVKAATGFKNVS